MFDQVILGHVIKMGPNGPDLDYQTQLSPVPAIWACCSLNDGFSANLVSKLHASSS